MGLLDSAEIEVPCPKKGCTGKVKRSMGRFRSSPTIQCPTCKTPIKFRAGELDRGMKAVDKSLRDLTRKLSIKIKL